MSHKKLVYITMLFMLVTHVVSAGNKTLSPYNEVYRAQCHYSVAENKMGSPMSIFIGQDSLYHLFFQYNPHNFSAGYVNVGHATSPDLLHWTTLPMIISQSDSATSPMSTVPWRVSVVDVNGSAKAIFNRYGVGLFSSELSQSMASSNEVLLSDDKVFKDGEPFVFFYEKSNKWVMLFFDRQNSEIHIYNSDDCKSWIETSSFSHSYGFPSLYEMRVDNKPDDSRWVLFCEKGKYMIGDFDGKTFTATSSIKAFDEGTEIGGVVCTPHISDKNKLLMVAELKSENLADMPSNGQLTFPTEVSLHDDGVKGVILYRKPVTEFLGIQGKAHEQTNKKVYPGLKNSVCSSIKGDVLHFNMEIDLLNSDYFGMLLRTSRTVDGAEIGYNSARKILSVYGIHLSDYAVTDSKISLEIILDRSSIEVFVDGGALSVSRSFAPDPDASRYEIFTNGGEILIDKLDVYQIKSIW